MKAEDITITYYHGSPNRLPKGQVLHANQASNDAYRSQSILSGLLEKYRPEDQPSRMQCWFLSDSKMQVKMATNRARFIYIVQPESSVFKHYYGWLNVAETIADTYAQTKDKAGYNQGKVAAENDEKFIEALRNYWTGVPLPKINPLKVEDRMISVLRMHGMHIVEYTTEAISTIKLAK